MSYTQHTSVSPFSFLLGDLAWFSEHDESIMMAGQCPSAMSGGLAAAAAHPDDAARGQGKFNATTTTAYTTTV
jgi:hypothetical protein